MFNNRLTVGLDWYDKNTDGLLVSVPPAMEVGMPVFWESGDVKSSSTQNAGSVNNRGFELELGWRDQIGDFSYSINANAAWLKNKVTYLDPLVGRISGRTVQGTNLTTTFEEGYPIWYMLGYVAEGINNEGRVIYTDFDGYTLQTSSQKVVDGKVSIHVGRNSAVIWKSIDF
jgi:outer membrane receptor protein involved in Fe transport